MAARFHAAGAVHFTHSRALGCVLVRSHGEAGISLDATDDNSTRSATAWRNGWWAGKSARSARMGERPVLTERTAGTHSRVPAVSSTCDITTHVTHKLPCPLIRVHIPCCVRPVHLCVSEFYRGCSQLSGFTQRHCADYAGPCCKHWYGCCWCSWLLGCCSMR